MSHQPNRIVLMSCEDVLGNFERSRVWRTAQPLQHDGRARHHDASPYYFGSPVTQVYTTFSKNNNTLSSEGSLDFTETQRKPPCICQYCTNQVRPSQSPMRFKDNIMQFADRATMTPVLFDASCSTCPALPGCASCEDKLKSILKKGDKDVGRDVFRRTILDSNIGEPERELDSMADQEVVSNQIKPESRKVIYNEGISDVIVEKIPLKPAQLIEHISPRSSEELATKHRMVATDNFSVPINNRGWSKYHNDCNGIDHKFEPPGDAKFFGTKSERKYLIQSLPLPTENVFYTHYPKMHRKVLKSERDVDNYLDALKL